MSQCDKLRKSSLKTLVRNMEVNSRENMERD